MGFFFKESEKEGEKRKKIKMWTELPINGLTSTLGSLYW